MSTRRPIAVALSAIAFSGLATALAWQGPPPGRRSTRRPSRFGSCSAWGTASRKPGTAGSGSTRGRSSGSRDGDSARRTAWSASTAGRPRPARPSRTPIRRTRRRETSPRRRPSPPRKRPQPTPRRQMPSLPTASFITIKGPTDAILSVSTDGGAFEVRLADLASGSPKTYLDGKVEAQRVPAGIPLVDGPSQQDFPTAAG